MMLKKFEDEGAWLAAAQGFFEAAREEAGGEGRRAEILLAGGATPQPLYRALAGLKLGGPPPRLWPGDERRLPLGHPDRNDHMIAQAFADAAWRPSPELRPWPDASDADPAQSYARSLAEAVSPRPRFDLGFLGIGADGHTAGLFPGDQASEAALAADYGELAVLTIAPSRPWLRMSLSARALAGARRLLFLTRGRDKLAMLERTMGEGGAALPWRRVAALAEASGAEVLLLHLGV